MRAAILYLSFALVLLLFFRRWMLDALIEAIEKFRGGGPPTSMHPSPANDSVLLRRKARKSES
jgi:hypothetical protein